jgi:hypothetical protein
MGNQAGRIGVAAVAAAALVGVASPAQADTSTTTSTATSTTAFTVGANRYGSDHAGDDFGMDVTSGVSIDARWASCSISGGTGAIKYNISAAGARQVLGTNFLAGTCLRVHYRGFTTTGGFTSKQYYNYNFA